MENSLIQKLDEFIRKYYKNQLIRGGIYTFTAVLLFFLALVVLEYFGNFSSNTRTILFYAFISFSALIIGRYIVYPLFKLNKLGKTINHETAAEIIGSHFVNVKDKLLNTLQLIQVSKSSSQDMSLVTASINQRIDELKPVPFSSAIDLSENKKYVKYAIIPLLIFIFIYFINVNIISDGTERLVNYSTSFTPQAPFKFELNSTELSVIENENFDLEVKLTGNSIPNQVSIQYDDKTYKLSKLTKNTFGYTFENVQGDKNFTLNAAGFSSKEYELKTIPNALIMGFNVELDYPFYTGLQDQTLENIGDFNVPQGTKIKWNFTTKNTDKVSFKFNDTTIDLDKNAQNLYSFAKTIKSSEKYSIKTANEYLTNKDEVDYFISVKTDEYPEITVNEKADSANDKLKYFNGTIQDDYGFSNLVFNYRIIKLDSNNKPLDSKFTSIPIQFNGNFNKDQFLHYFDFKSIGLGLGEKAEYYFRVWDNDKVNGYKSARTQTKFIKAPTKEELKNELDGKSKDIKKEMDNTLKDADKLQDDIKKLKEDILNKKNLDWQDKKKVQEILDQQKELQKQLDQINNQNEEKNQQKEEFNQQQSEELKQKEERLKEMMEELNSPEMEELYKKLEKMTEKMNKDQLQQTLEQMDLENIDLKKELERSLEQFKQLEMDEKLDELSQELEELAEKQEKLAKNDSLSTQEKEEEQKEINEEFEELQKEMEEMKEKNEEMENKRDMDGLKDKEEQIKQDMQKSLEKLQKNQEKGAQKKQEDAAEKMKEMSQDMQSMMSMNNQEQNAENMEDLRALLENLITLSFDQESLMQELKGTATNDPKYVKLGQEQKKLKDDAKMIEDSLFALSMRVEQIQSIVNKEINKVNYNIKNSLKNIEERKTKNATVNQQFTMTSINNLALLLDEALKQMQQQMANKMPGSGSCNNPGGSSPKPSLIPSLKKAQSGVSEQLKKLQQQMGKQKGKSAGKDGKGGESGKSAKDLARMAAEQAAIRDAVKKMGEQLNGDGTGAGNGFKKIEKDMEQVEEDIINNNITPETIKRQQDILTRLLESEKAVREREFDKKRESKSTKNRKFSNPSEFLEYKRKKEKELELLRTIPPSLLPYYKNRVNEYFNKTY